MSSPLVSIVIPYYKRREVIGKCLDSVLQQDYPAKEVILIDNHSEDDIQEFAGARDSKIRVVHLPENLGACAARNVGIREAQGEILIFIDDDMGFASPSEISKTVQAFDDHPDAHVLALRICDSETGQMRLREWCHARYWRDFSESEFETLWFCEGASAFRREVFEQVGPYYERLFYGAEGWDLTLRLLERGFRILYCPHLRAWHRPSSQARSVARQYYYFTRAYVIMAYKDYHFLDGLRFVAPKLAMMVYFTARSRAWVPFVRGLRDGIRQLPQVRSDRTPVSRATLKYLCELERWRPSLAVRLMKHRSEVQL